MVLLRHLKPEVIEALRSLILEDKKLTEYIEIFDKEINRALQIETYQDSSVKSIITHVNKLPSGNEEGEFLGLDFSSPTIKVMLVKLENKECTVTRKMYDIPKKYMTGKSVKLFDFIAKSIVDFMKGIKLIMPRIPLGVTFGFPIEQTSLQDCKLIRWTKGFECNDLIGKNIFYILKDSIRKFPELKRLYVIGILNDAVSAVLACAWQEPTCMMGAVIGFGLSCCYAEKVYRVTKYEYEHYGIKDIYINLESSEFGVTGCLEYLRTEFDKQVDEESINPGCQINDKLTSMIYLGEISRLAIIKCIQTKVILKGVVSDELMKKNSFTLQHMAKVESDPDTNHQNCREVLQEFGYPNPTDEDCFQVQFACRCVSRRSVNLIAAQLATVINRINVPSVIIATDGELVKNYPNFKWYLEKKLRSLKNENCEFQLRELKESGLGPAVMAALFGEDIMNRDEKLRRLPGFPMEKCHFGKKGRCMNPDCNVAHPCDTSNVNPLTHPMLTKSSDLFIQNCCLNVEQNIEIKENKESKVNKENREKENKFRNKKRDCGACRGYKNLPECI